MEIRIWHCPGTGAINSNVWTSGSTGEPQRSGFAGLLPAQSPCWLFKTAYFTFPLPSCTTPAHQTLKNLLVHRSSGVLVSFASESKPHVKALHCGIRGAGKKFRPESFSCVALPFLIPFGEVTCRDEMSACRSKCMTWVSCCVVLCWGWA